jgi:hypothetical protein
VDLEPVGAPTIPGAGFGHADHEALPQAAGLAGGAVLLVDDTAVVVLTLLDDGLIVASPPKEGLAPFACEGPKVESGGRLFAHSTELVLHGVQLVNL